VSRIASFIRPVLGGLLLALTACAGDPGPSPMASALRPGAAPEPMVGRWVLAGAGTSQCNVTFGAGEGEGTIAPEGGCPGNFFTSRKWTFEQGSLLIRDHTGAPLATLAHVGPGRFEGKATGGLQMTLSR
jgi:hypothetical protein